MIDITETLSQSLIDHDYKAPYMMVKPLPILRNRPDYTQPSHNQPNQASPISQYLETRSVSPNRGPEAAPPIMCRAYLGKYLSRCLSVSDTSEMRHEIRLGNRAGTCRFKDTTVPPIWVGFTSTNSLVLLRLYLSQRCSTRSFCPRPQQHCNDNRSNHIQIQAQVCVATRSLPTYHR